MWARSVWLEGGREMEGVIPSNWVIGDCVLWPNKSNVTKLLKERQEPNSKWRRFQLVKTKHQSGTLFHIKKYYL